MFNFVQTAYAAATTGTAQGGSSSTIIMIVLMVAVFYFLLIRPENKRKKDAETMRNSLKKGDWLTTIGGVYGRVVSVTDRTVVIETSEDRVRLEFVKAAIGQLGTLDEQAAAQQRGKRPAAKPAKKAEKAEKAAEIVEAPVDEIPAAEEKKD